MQALRAGLKRVDIKKHKGKEGKQNENNVPIDTRPILRFRDPNPEFSVNNPASWEPNSLGNTSQILFSEYSVPASNQFQIQQDTKDGSPPSKGIMISSSTENLPDNKLVSRREDPWLSRMQYDENMPPTNNHSFKKVNKSSKWNQLSPANEPLLVESPVNRSMDVLPDRLISSPLNSRGSRSLETEESTNYSSGGSINNPIRIISPRFVIESNAEPTDSGWKKEDRWKLDKKSDYMTFRNSKGNTRKNYQQAFDPFENNVEHVDHRRHNEEGSFQNHCGFEESIRFQQGIKHHELRSDVDLEKVDSIDFQKSDQEDNFLSSGNIWTRSHQNNDTFSKANEPSEHISIRDSTMEHFIKPKYPFRDDFASDTSSEWFEGDSSSFQAIEYNKNGANPTHKDLPLTKVKKKSFVQNARKSLDPGVCIETVTVISPERCQHENVNNYRELESHKEEVTEMESLTSEMNSEKYSDEIGTIDIRDDSTTVSTSRGLSRKITNSDHINDSNSMNGDCEVQQKSIDTTDQSLATSILSELVEESGNKSGLRLVVLLSTFSGNLKQRTEQERAISILKARNISNIEEVDGSSHCNKDRRNLLFKISGNIGKYPQFYLQNMRGIAVYLGDFEWLEYMNDIGSISDETLFGVTYSAQDLTGIKSSNFDPTTTNDYIGTNSKPIARSDNPQRKGSATMLDSTGSDNDREACGIEEYTPPPSNFSNKSKIVTSPTKSIPTRKSIEEENDNSKNLNTDISESPSSLLSNSQTIKTEPTASNVDVSLYWKTQIDGCEESELSMIGSNQRMFTATENEEKNYKRWRQSIGNGKTLSLSERETPIGASVNEIKMINTFLALLRPDFDGSLSPDELEQLCYRSWKAGLTHDFTNKILNQSIGVMTKGIENGPDLENNRHIPCVQTLEANKAALSSLDTESNIGDDTYDDRDFTRKTPKEQSKIDCLVYSASNIVGGELVETIRTAISGDSESRRGWRSVNLIENTNPTVIRHDISENKSGWRPSEMIENIKRSLSGETNESVRTWRSAVFRGDSEK